MKIPGLCHKSENPGGRTQGVKSRGSDTTGEDGLRVGQYLTGDGLTLGKNFCRDVTTVGIVLGSDGLTLARGGDGAPKN